MHLALELVDEDPTNVRVSRPSAAAEEAFRESMKAVGQLQPIEVRLNSDGDRYTVVFGARRLRAARELGWKTIEATVIDGAEADAKLRQAIENMVRAPMEPVDSWLALSEMVKRGHTLNHASLALGISDRAAQQFMKLAAMDDAVIEAIRLFGMPDSHQVILIASAPREIQKAAMKGSMEKDHEGKKAINWHAVASKCQLKRISQTVAIFDLKKAKVPFDRDLFAQPGSPEEYTTTEIEAFIAAQTAALAARVEKERAKGYHVDTAKFRLDPYGRGDIVIPKGFERKWGAPKGKPKGDSKGRILYAVRAAGHGIGSIDEMYVEPEQRASSRGKTRASVPAVAAPPRTITSEGLDLVARAKTQAVRERLQSDWADMDAMTLLRLLLLGLGGSNVTVRAEHGTIQFTDVLTRLVSPDGRVKYALHGPDPRELAADVLGRMVVFGGAKTWPQNQSGSIAETIGDALGAETCLPRFDTEEALKTISLSVLKDLANTSTIAVPKKTATAIRSALAGKLPDWRPGEAMFKPQPLTPDEVRAASADEDGEPHAAAGDEDWQIEAVAGGSDGEDKLPEAAE